MNQLLDRLLKIPPAQKALAAILLVAAITAGNYFLVIQDVYTAIDNSRARLQTLEKDLVAKKVIADNLNQYRRDKEILERRLAEALTELPKEPEIDELLRQLNDVGKKSGLDIVSLEPGVETPQTFYASIPIKMEGAGNYHEIAVFFESISKLRRIVNVTSISFGSPARKNEKVVLKATYLATTFRFIEKAAAPEKKPPPAQK